MQATKSATHRRKRATGIHELLARAVEPADFFFTPGRAGETRAAFRSRPLGAVKL